MPRHFVKCSLASISFVGVQLQLIWLKWEQNNRFARACLLNMRDSRSKGIRKVKKRESEKEIFFPILWLTLSLFLLRSALETCPTFAAVHGGGFLNFVTFKFKHSHLCTLPLMPMPFAIADSDAISFPPTVHFLFLSRPFFPILPLRTGDSIFLWLFFVPNSNRSFLVSKLRYFEIITSALKGQSIVEKHGLFFRNCGSIIFLLQLQADVIMREKNHFSIKCDWELAGKKGA